MDILSDILFIIINRFKLTSRSLAIGGPGAKIYAVPESTDLEALALNHSARNLNLESMLVARGPVVYYNREGE